MLMKAHVLIAIVLVTANLLLVPTESGAADQKGDVFELRPPIGYWRFDEGTGTVVKDSSGQGNDGRIRNLGTCALWVGGRAGKALAFSEKSQGNCGFVDIPNMGRYDYSEGVTFEAWVKPQGTTAADYIFSTQASERSPGSRVLYYGGAVGEIIFSSFRQGGKLWSVTTHPRISFKEGSWYHIACVCDNSVLKVYIDGEEIRASEGTGAVVVEGRDVFTIGAYLSGAAYGFNGVIDEVKLYDYPRRPVDILRDAFLR